MNSFNQKNKNSELNFEVLSRELEKSGGFRVLRRFKPFPPGFQYKSPPPDQELKIGLYVDVETTGLNLSEDKIVQFGAVKFNYDDNGNVYEILETFEEYEDPKIPIPQEATNIHGITNADVTGHRINEDKIVKLLQNVDLIIAHNALFDRKTIERRFDFFDLLLSSEASGSAYVSFENIPWACSWKEIPWEKGFGSIGKKLGNVLVACGEFCDNLHGALVDCLVGVHVIAKAKDDESRSAFSYLLEASSQNSCLVFFETPKGNGSEAMKALLISKGYQWVKSREGKWIGLQKVCLNAQEALEVRENEDKANPFVIRSLSVTPFTRYSDRIPPGHTWPILKL